MAKPKPKGPMLVIASNVIQQVRQHARSQMKTEVCGVLIGCKQDDTIHVEAAIEGVNAAQAGTHVTFTQNTWEHVYNIKDKLYPDGRIVGWYHSHPGFGVFLSDHDAFIHKNFFSSPDQIAWVYDPQSDEEGCFGWAGERLERMAAVEIRDRRGGELVETNSAPEPSIPEFEPTLEEPIRVRPQTAQSNDKITGEPVWLRVISTVLSHLVALLLGLFVAWFVFPRLVPVPVPVDPVTGQPLTKFMRPEATQPKQQPSSDPASEVNGTGKQPVPPASEKK
jgi:proteasome lid subunit RPN8/RPN11